VTHVDDSNAAPGTGTFEDPFTELNAPVGDIIAVRTGNTTAATPLIGGIDLLDNQRLLGEGVPHTFEDRGRGTFALPSLATVGPKPFVTVGAAGPVVMLANNNEVSGFNIITTPSRAAIEGSVLKDFVIDSVDVTGDGSAFVLTNARGTGSITNSSFDLTPDTAPGGVIIRNTNTPPLNLTIDTFATATGGRKGLLIGANNSTITTTINGFLADANGDGLELNASFSGNIDATVTNSTFNNSVVLGPSVGDGIRVISLGAAVNLNVDNTTATGSETNGLTVALTANSDFTGVFTNSDLSNSGNDGINLLLSNTVGSTLEMTDTLVDNAGRDGLHAILLNASEMDITIVDGSFENAGEDAFDVFLGGGSELNLDVDPTPATGAGANGFRFEVENSSILTALFDQSDLSGAGANGILGDVNTGSTANVTYQNGSLANSTLNAVNVSVDNATADVTVTDSSANDSGQNGLLFNVANAGNLSVLFDNSSLLDSGVNAIQGAVNGFGSLANVTLNKTYASGSGSDGLRFVVDDGGELVADLTKGSFSNSGDNGILGAVDSGGSVTLNLTDFSSNNSTLDGINLNVTDGSTVQGTFSESNFNGNGEDGLDLMVNNSNVTLNLGTSNIINNDANGLLFDVQNMGDLTVSAAGGNAITLNNGSGLVGTVDGAGSTANFDFNNTQLDNNGVNGVNFTADNSGSFSLNLVDSSIDNSVADGILGSTANNATAVLNLENTSVNDSGQSGMILSATSNSNISGTLQSLSGSADLTSFDGNALGGIGITVDDATVDFTFDSVNVDDNQTGDGLLFDVANGGQFSLDLTAGSFSQNDLAGINGTVADAGSLASITATSSARLDRIAVDENEEDGITFNVSADGELEFLVRNISVSRNGEFGMHTVVTGVDSEATFNIRQSVIESNGIPSLNVRDGFNLEVLNGAEVTADFLDTVITLNKSRGVVALVEGPDSTLNFTTDDDVEISGHAGDGIRIDVLNSGILNATVDGMISSNFGGDGIEINASTLGILNDVNLTGSFEQSGGHGALITADNATINRLSLQGNFDSNGRDGVNLTMVNASLLTNLFYSGTSSINSEDGFSMDIDSSEVTSASIGGFFVGNIEDGLHVNLTGSAEMPNLRLSGSRAVSNSLNGFHIEVFDTATLSLIASSARGEGNVLDGMNILVDQPGVPAVVNISVINSNFSNNGSVLFGNADGVQIITRDQAVVQADFRTNTFDNNSRNGVFVLTEDYSKFGRVGNPSTFGGNTFTSNGTNGTEGGLRLDAEDSSYHNVLLASIVLPDTSTVDNNFIGNVNGLIIENDSDFAADQTTYGVFNSTFSNNVFDGISAELGGVGSDMLLVIGANDIDDLEDEFASNNFSGNGRDGVSITTSNGDSTIAIDDIDSIQNGANGVRFLHTGGTVDATVVRSTLSDNGTGLAAEARADGSRFVIGFPNQGNLLEDNTGQGLSFATLTTTVDNTSIFFDGDPANPIDHVNEQSVAFVTAEMIAESNVIRDNNFHGMVIAVGSSTRMNAVVNNNLFDGNFFDDPIDNTQDLFDVTIFPIRSVNPPTSIDNNSPTLDTVFLDPVGRLDLVFGASGNPVNSKFGNRGDQIRVTEEGSSITASILPQFDGRFSNIDPLKRNVADPFTGIDTDRPVRGNFQVHGRDANPALDLLDGTQADGGNFFQNPFTGGIQSMFLTFDGANFNFPALGTPFPDPLPFFAP